MTNAIQEIIEILEPAFAQADEKVLEATQQWARGRKQALVDFKQSDEYQTLRRNQEALYRHMFAICGGKTWYAVFNSNNAVGIEAFVVKNHQAMIQKRNTMIASKLTKAGVTSVVDGYIGYTRDGFDGVFCVESAEGQSRITINTIYAGGYNIQCLHMRVLVKIKKGWL